jgi:hypothetical protein
MPLLHRTFVGPTVYFQGGGVIGNRETIREIAEQFAASIGAENVVSVVEEVTTFGPFTIVVWYRSDDPAQASALVHVTNIDIRNARARSPKHAFPLDALPGDPAAK